MRSHDSHMLSHGSFQSRSLELFGQWRKCKIIFSSHNPILLPFVDCGLKFLKTKHILMNSVKCCRRSSKY